MQDISVFENAPIAFAEVDAQGVQEWLNRFRAEGVDSLRSRLESDPASALHVLSRLTVRRVNRMLVELLEARSEQDLLERSPQILESIPAATLIDLLQAYRNDQRFFRTETRLLTLKERPLHALVGVSVPENAGRADLSCCLVALTDITRQKEAEEALREREAQLRALADNLPNAMVYQMDARASRPQFTYVSASVERLHEVTPAAVLADASVLYRQILPQYLPGLQAAEVEAFLTRSPFRYRMQCRLPSGRVRWSRLVAAPRTVAADRVVWDGVELDITEQRQIEDALREREERLRMVLEASGAGWWDWDLNSSRVTADRRAKALFGLAPDAEASFEVFLNCLVPDQIPRILNELPAAMASSGDFDSEFHLAWPDGSLHWVLAKGRSVWDDSKRTHRLMGLVWDITQRKQTEEASQESAEFNRTLLETLPLGIVLANPYGVVTYISPQARRIFHVPEDQGLGTTPFDWIAPEHHEVVRQRMRRVLVDKIPQPPVEYRMFATNGAPVWMEMTSSPVLDDQGHLRGVVTVCQDVTERRQGQEKLRRTVERLELLSEVSAGLLAGERPREIVESLCRKVMGHLGCDVFLNYLVDEGRGRLHLSASHGLPPETVREFEWLDLGVAACGWVAREGRCLVGEDLADNQDPRMDLPRQLGLQAYACHPLFNQGRVTGTLAFASRHSTTFDENDRSLMKTVADQVAIAIQRIRLLESLEQRAWEAQTANAAKGQFLANVSHELRTPMNAIIGMTDLALADDVSPAVRDCLVTVKDSADVLLMLLNELLDFSRIEAGKIAIESIPFDLHQVLEVTVRAIAVRAFEKGLELIVDLPDDLPRELVGDPLRLRQVLTNLIGNAIKFTERGDVVLGVEIERQTSEEARLRFAVRDTGIGISPEDQRRIFAPFSQVDASTTRRFGGTGLGLSIASNLVDMMNGRLNVESQPGQGSAFSFTLEFPRPQHVAPAERSRQLMIDQLRGLPVLVADDHDLARRILARTLAGWGMLPGLASDGADLSTRLHEAVGHANRCPLVILDDTLLTMNGTNAIQAMGDQCHPSPVVVLMSAVARGLATGQGSPLPVATVVLSKPVFPDALLQALREAMGVTIPEERPAAYGTTRQGFPEPAARSLRVLLAEDIPANQKLVVRILRRRGHTVELAQNGREAVERFRRQAFDLVLMDVQMPVMDGLEATAAIRRLQQGTWRIPIVAMTAHAMKGDAERFLEADMDAYLAKPIDVQELIRVTEELAGKHEATTGPDN